MSDNDVDLIQTSDHDDTGIIYERSTVDMVCKSKEGEEAGFYRVSAERMQGEATWYNFKATPWEKDCNGELTPPTKRAGKSLKSLSLQEIHPAIFEARCKTDKAPIMHYIGKSNELLMSAKQTKTFLDKAVEEATERLNERLRRKAVIDAHNQVMIRRCNSLMMRVRARYCNDPMTFSYQNVYGEVV
ncbi:MAG: hypothetical protein FGM22_07440 [Burkholderiaceae bacterium]|nr:hypothetical protein [Burkholderiaceae bacterium]